MIPWGSSRGPGSSRPAAAPCSARSSGRCRCPSWWSRPRPTMRRCAHRRRPQGGGSQCAKRARVFPRPRVLSWGGQQRAGWGARPLGVPTSRLLRSAGRRATSSTAAQEGQEGRDLGGERSIGPCWASGSSRQGRTPLPRVAAGFARAVSVRGRARGAQEGDRRRGGRQDRGRGAPLRPGEAVALALPTRLPRPAGAPRALIGGACRAGCCCLS